MNMKHVIYFFALLLSLSILSCTNNLKFQEPQPSGDKNEKKFKNSYQGTYLCLDDSSILFIKKDMMIQEWLITAEISKNELDTTAEIKHLNGQYFIEGKDEPLDITILGDSAVLRYKLTDTLFQLSDNQLLRYFKGQYFLNYKEADDQWIVKTLNLNREGLLTLSDIHGGEDEIEKIKEMTPVEEITNEEGKVVDYKVQPTKKELKKILKSDVIQEGSRFQKIRKL